MKINDYFLSKEEYEKYISNVNQEKYKIEKVSENGEKIIEEKSYILTYEEYRKSLWEAILGMSIDIEDALDSKHESPTSFIIVAPPGAGKTLLAGYEEAKFTDEYHRKIIRIDPDKIGLYHKYYKEIYNEIPSKAFPELQKFIRTASNDTIRPLVHDFKFDTLTEGTFGDTDGYKKIISEQKEKGYHVVISTIVTPNIERDLSSCERFQMLLNCDLPARIVDFNYSKNVEDKYLETLKQVEQEGLYDEIKVYRRGKDKKSAPILIYTSGDGRYRSAVEAVRDEITKGERKIVNNADTFQLRINNLREQINNSQVKEFLEIQLQQLDDIQERFDKMLIRESEQAK